MPEVQCWIFSLLPGNWPSGGWAYPLIPDAACSWRNGKKRKTIAFEYDRGEERPGYIVRRKFRRYQKGLEGFPISQVVMVVDVSARQERLQKYTAAHLPQASSSDLLSLMSLPAAGTFKNCCEGSPLRRKVNRSVRRAVLASSIFMWRRKSERLKVIPRLAYGNIRPLVSSDRDTGRLRRINAPKLQGAGTSSEGCLCPEEHQSTNQMSRKSLNADDQRWSYSSERAEKGLWRDLDAFSMKCVRVFGALMRHDKRLRIRECEWAVSSRHVSSQPAKSSEDQACPRRSWD